MNLQKALALAVMIGGASLASASTSFTFGNWSSNGTVTVSGNATPAIGPYTGTLAGQTVQLYCDDFNDSVHTNDSYQVNLTKVSDITTSTSAVRFASLTKDQTWSGLVVPSGTTIYTEIAWLLTQESQASSFGTKEAIQDAIWGLTANVTIGSTGNPDTNYATDTTGKHNNVLNPYFWASLATNKTYLNSTSNITYTTAYASNAASSTSSITLFAADYTTWQVIDQATGLGVNGQTQYQELLTQTSSTNGVTVPGAPEPGTFLLFGGAIAAIGFRKFRKA